MWNGHGSSMQAGVISTRRPRSGYILHTARGVPEEPVTAHNVDFAAQVVDPRDGLKENSRLIRQRFASSHAFVSSLLSAQSTEAQQRPHQPIRNATWYGGHSARTQSMRSSSVSGQMLGPSEVVARNDEQSSMRYTSNVSRNHTIRSSSNLGAEDTRDRRQPGMQALRAAGQTVGKIRLSFTPRAPSSNNSQRIVLGRHTHR